MPVHVCRLTDLLFDPPFPFQCLARLGDSQCLQLRLLEDARLCLLETTTLPQPVLPLMTPPLPALFQWGLHTQSSSYDGISHSQPSSDGISHTQPSYFDEILRSQPSYFDGISHTFDGVFHTQPSSDGISYTQLSYFNGISHTQPSSDGILYFIAAVA